MLSDLDISNRNVMDTSTKLLRHLSAAATEFLAICRCASMVLFAFSNRRDKSDARSRKLSTLLIELKSSEKSIAGDEKFKQEGKHNDREFSCQMGRVNTTRWIHDMS